jgi:hypothetical protein
MLPSAEFPAFHAAVGLEILAEDCGWQHSPDTTEKRTPSGKLTRVETLRA